MQKNNKKIEVNGIPKDLIVNFNELDYLKVNPDVELAIKNGDFRDVLHHLELFGLEEIKNGQRKFHIDFELFSETWYLVEFPEVKSLLKNGEYFSCFEHFCKIGYNILLHRFQNKNGIKHYDLEARTQISTLIKDLDEEAYLKSSEDVKRTIANGDFRDVLHHLELFGLEEIKNGQRKFHIDFEPFDESLYLGKFEDVVDLIKKGEFVSGFEHFCLNGYAEIKNGSRIWNVNSDIDSFHDSISIDKVLENSDQIDLDFIREQFEPDFYLESNTDLKNLNMDLFDHYLTYGWRERRSPASWFDINSYLDANIDILKANVEPFSHYLLYGKRENRKLKLTENKLPMFPIDSVALEFIPKLDIIEKVNKYKEYIENSKVKTAIKTIAFYLPQFHPFPENDKWWGKGFTEWTNVTKAKSNFVGHYQPHLPIHNGFYDLRVEEVMIEQVKLAKNYGIYGFNYYYYWFDGKILMDLPLKNMLKNKNIDMPFCLTWANENWTRRWDGAEHDVLIAQDHSKKDSIAFIHNLFEYFNDKRYIRIDKKPVLIVYRADIIPDIKKMTRRWRKEAKKAGYKGLYLISAQTFGTTCPEEFDFDASMEFPPHTVMSHLVNEELEITNSSYEGHIYDYDTTVKSAVSSEEPSYDLYRTAMLGWDNTARKQNNSNIFANYSTYRFKQWVSHLANTAHNNDKYDNNFVFINAWNEWAEGTHLEPDRKFGYAALDAVYDVVSQYDVNIVKKLYPVKKLEPQNDIAVIIHLHYSDMWEEINDYLSNFTDNNFDLYISITNTKEKIVERILNYYPNANIFLFENRGRDILPLIQIMKNIINFNYKAVCKVHSKKSLYREDGNEIKDELFNAVVGNKDVIQSIVDLFNSDEKIGLVLPRKYNIAHTEKNMRYCYNICSILEEIFEVEFIESSFPAGSMYWFRPDALKQLCNIESKHIPLEDGWSDGTVMHAIERYVEILVKKNDYKTVLI